MSEIVLMIFLGSVWCFLMRFWIIYVKSIWIHIVRSRFNFCIGMILIRIMGVSVFDPVVTGSVDLFGEC